MYFLISIEFIMHIILFKVLENKNKNYQHHQKVYQFSKHSAQCDKVVQKDTIILGKFRNLKVSDNLEGVET